MVQELWNFSPLHTCKTLILTSVMVICKLQRYLDSLHFLKTVLFKFSFRQAYHKKDLVTNCCGLSTIPSNTPDNRLSRSCANIFFFNLWFMTLISNQMLWLQEGKDVVAKAKTGSGKTFAYLLPLLHDLLKLSSEGRIRKPAPNAFILVPTRELCQQVVGLNLSFAEIVLWFSLGWIELLQMLYL